MRSVLSCSEVLVRCGGSRAGAKTPTVWVLKGMWISNAKTWALEMPTILTTFLHWVSEGKGGEAVRRRGEGRGKGRGRAGKGSMSRMVYYSLKELGK